MKAIFVSFYQAFYDEIVEVMDKLEIRGFTAWQEVVGRGSVNGEPHYGTHAWPTLNSAMMVFVSDEKVKAFMDELRKLDESAPEQGLHAFVMPVEGEL